VHERYVGSWRRVVEVPFDDVRLDQQQSIEAWDSWYFVHCGSNLVIPCNPFFADVYHAGNVIRGIREVASSLPGDYWFLEEE